VVKVEKEVHVAEVKAFKTKSGNTRFVLKDDEGNEHTTFGEAIARQAIAAEGGRAGIECHEEQRNGYTNVYLDKVEPLEDHEGGGSQGVRSTIRRAGARSQKSQFRRGPVCHSRAFSQ
jgi:hypothetical protein